VYGTRSPRVRVRIRVRSRLRVGSRGLRVRKVTMAIDHLQNITEKTL
jgi:hypothetical protein